MPWNMKKLCEHGYGHKYCELTKNHLCELACDGNKKVCSFGYTYGDEAGKFKKIEEKQEEGE